MKEPDHRPGELTELLAAWSEAGDRAALEEVLRRALPELRRMARGRLRRERGDGILESLELVNAAWLKLAPQTRKRWENRRHFFAVYSQAMFQVLVEEAKRRDAGKRRGVAVPLEESWMVRSGTAKLDMLDFALALGELAKDRPRAAEAAKLRYLSGLTDLEIAEELVWDGAGVSASTVRRDLAVAKAWLYARLRGDG